jgi:hypothetical protein
MAAIPMHGDGWTWREPRRGDHFRTCSYCGSIHPEDLAAEIIPQGNCAVCGKTGWSACFEGQRPGWLSEEDLARLRESHPEEAAAIEGRSQPHSYDPGGAYASWADQKYGWPHKFYVQGLKPRDPGMLHVLSHSTGAQRPDSGARWIADADLTTEQRAILAADGWQRDGEERGGWWCFAPRPTLFAKFYTAHLADPAIGEEVKDKIFKASGVRFHFTGDRVEWHGAACPCADLHPGS